MALNAGVMGSSRAAEPAVVVYEAPKGMEPSPFYEVTVAGKAAFVYPCQVGRIADAQGNLLPNRHQLQETAPAASATFDFTGRVEVAVTIRGQEALHRPLRSATVRPLRHGIQPRIEGDTLRFVLERPCQLSIEPNGTVVAPLFVFANAPEAEPPPASGAPDVLYFGPGVHEPGLINKVKSGSTIYLAGGAVVYGQLDAEGVTNVTVRGRGILDGSKASGGRLMSWFKSKDIVVEGIVMRESPSWGINVSHCDHVRIRNVKIITGRGADAIDVCSSEDVAVEGVFARTHDDTLNVKGLTDLAFGYPADKDGKWLPTGNRKAARNIRFEDCVVWNDRAHGLMIGPETRATEIADILYRRVDIIHALSVDAIGIYSADAAPIGPVRYEDVRVEDPRCMSLISIRIQPQYTTADPQLGPVRDVTFSRLDVTSPTPVYSGICGDSNEIARLTFEDVRVNGELMRSAEQMKVLPRGRVSDMRFVVSP